MLWRCPGAEGNVGRVMRLSFEGFGHGQGSLVWCRGGESALPTSDKSRPRPIESDEDAAQASAAVPRPGCAVATESSVLQARSMQDATAAVKKRAGGPMRAARGEGVGETVGDKAAVKDDREDPLFRRFLQRDPEALAGVEETVRRSVRFRGWDIPTADRGDVVQETLLQVWREVARPGFLFRQNFTGFVCVVAFRRCVDWRRSRRLAEAIPPGDPADPERMGRPDVEALRSERASLAHKVLASLPEADREVVVLRVIEGKRYQEIAASLGRTEGAVRTQVWHCLKVARRVIESLQRPARPPRKDRP